MLRDQYSGQVMDRRKIFNAEVILPLADNFFQAKMEGALDAVHKIKRPIIFVGNHSGGSLSWDNIVFQALLDRLDGQASDRKVSLVRLVHKRLYQDHITPFHIRDWWKSMGCVEVSFGQLLELLRAGRNVYISPEGVEGLSKPGWDPCGLMRFSSSFVYAAKSTNAVVCSTG